METEEAPARRVPNQAWMALSGFLLLFAMHFLPYVKIGPGKLAVFRLAPSTFPVMASVVHLLPPSALLLAIAGAVTVLIAGRGGRWAPGVLLGVGFAELVTFLGYTLTPLAAPRGGTVLPPSGRVPHIPPFGHHLPLLPRPGIEPWPILAMVGALVLMIAGGLMLVQASKEDVVSSPPS